MMAIGGGAGGGKSAGDVRAGGAYFEVVGRDGLSGVLTMLKAKALAFSASMRHVGGSLFAGGLAVGATPFASLIQGVEKLSALEDLTDIFGLSAEAASKMAYAFNVAGVETSDLEKVFKELAKTNTTGKPLDEYLFDVADGLLAIEEPSKRAEVAMKLLGKQGLNFLRVADDLHRLYGEAPLFTMEDLKNAEKLGQQWRSLGVSFSSALVPLFKYLAPLLKLVADFARENTNLMLVVAGVATGMVVLGATIFALGAILKGVILSWGALLMLLKAGAVLFGLFVSPIGLLVGGFLLLIAVTTDWTKTFKQMGETFSQTFKGIKDAVVSGDLELAFEILGQGLRAVWFRMLFDMAKGIDDFLERNRQKFIALAALMGGAKGAFIGAKRGPWGALIGAAVGAGVGGGAAWGAGELARGIAKDSGLEDKAKMAEGKLAGLVAIARMQAEKARQEEDKKRQNMNLGAEATKGGFNPNSALQQFGYGDKASQLLDVNKEMLGEMRLAPDKIGKAVGGALKMQ